MFRDRLISSLIGSLFFLFFQPFGLSQMGDIRWVLLIGMSLAVAGVSIVSELIIRYVFRLPHSVSRGQRYMNKRNRYYQLINIPLLTLSIALMLDQWGCREGIDNHFSWSSVLQVFCTICCCSFVIGLYWSNYYSRKNYERQLEDAMYLNGILEERQRSFHESPNPKVKISPCGCPILEENDDPIHIEGATKESLDLRPSDLIYAESDANYVKIYYCKEGTPVEVSLRCSISQIEEIFRNSYNIIRCHRAYVVNLAKVTQFNTQDHSLRLSLRGVNSRITVSKTYLQIVKERIINPPKIG